MKYALMSAVLFFGALSLSATDAPKENVCDAFRPKLFKQFGDYATNPDGMTIDKDGNLYISSPNFNNHNYPGVIMKFEKADPNKFSIFFAPPIHKDTGIAGPMGMAFGCDGNLYYADNQYFKDKNYKSRLMRLTIKDGTPIKAEPVVEGFKLSNAVRIRDGVIYVTDTFSDDPADMGYIYAIPMADFANGPVKLAPKTEKDKYRIIEQKCTPRPRGDNASIDGMDFDKDGNIYYGNFGDGRFYTSKRLADGKYEAPKLLTEDFECCDGIVYYPRKNWIIITDSQANAVRYWDITNSKLGLLWQNGDTDGADGLLDQPCEPIVIDGKLYIASFDMPFDGLVNKKFDNINTLSVIDLNEGSSCPLLSIFGL